MSTPDILCVLVPIALCALLGWGNLMTTSPANFHAARWCFILSAVFWWGLVVMLGVLAKLPFLSRGAIVGLAAGLCGIALTEVLREVAMREEAFAQTLSRPHSVTNHSLASEVPRAQNQSPEPSQQAPSDCSKSGASQQFDNITLEDGQGTGMLIVGNPSICIGNLTTKHIDGNSIIEVPSPPTNPSEVSHSNSSPQSPPTQ